MKKILFIFLITLSLTSFAQKSEPVKDEIIIKRNGSELSIFIDDKKADIFDILIYESYDDIKVDVTKTNKNPYIVDITGWKPTIYHIKIDYPSTTQFRHYEIKEN